MLIWLIAMVRSHLKVLGSFLAVAALFYWRTVLSRQYSLLTGFEEVNQAYCWYHFVANSIKHGLWAVWDPYTFGGHNFAGEMQTGAFYPMNLLLAAIPFNRHGLLSPRVYDLVFLAAHVLGAYFMFLLIRQLKQSRFAAFLGGICFSLGGIFRGITLYPDRLQSAIWLPLVFLFALRSLDADSRRRRMLYAVLCGVALGLPILAGGLHFAMMEAIILATALAAYAVRQRRALDPAQWIRRCSSVASILVAAALLAVTTGAVQLFDSMEYSKYSQRWVAGGALPSTEKIPYSRLSDGLLPNAWVEMVFAYPAAPVAAGENYNPYLGVLPLFLALIGIWKRRSDPWVAYLAALAVAAFVYAQGSYSFLHGLAYALVPFLWMAREAARFTFMTDFALAILAAFGADALLGGAMDRSWAPLKTALKWCAALAGLALLLPAVIPHQDLTPWVSFSLVTILASCGLLAYVMRGHTGPFARFLILALVLSDLYAFDWSPRNVAEVQAKGADVMDQILSASGAVDFLKSQPGSFRVAVTPEMPNIGDLYGIQTTFGAAATMTLDYNSIRVKPDLLNARYVLAPASDPRPDPVYRDSAWKIYENKSAYPRAWLVHETETYGSTEEVARRMDQASFDGRRTALLADAAKPELDPKPSDAAEQAGVTRYSANRIELSVRSSGRAMLVLSENYYPGWKAAVNGRPEPIWKVDSGLRGVLVPDGESVVVLDYRPTSVAAGAALTIASLFTGLAALFWCWRSNARPGEPAGADSGTGAISQPTSRGFHFRPTIPSGFSLLLLIVAAASLIPRLILGASQFTHYDGYMHIFIATQDRWKFFWVENRGDAHPPLFYVLLRFVSLFGHSHLVYRSIGILAGCASTYVMGLVAAKACRNAAIALLAAAAYGLAITNIDLTTDVRGYPIAILFLLLAFHAYLGYIERPLDDAAAGAVARFGCFTALAILSEYYSLFFLAACLVIPWVRALTDTEFRRAFLVSVRRLWRSWALALGGVAGVVFVLYRVHMRYQPAAENNVSTFYWSPQSGTSLWRFLIDGLRLEIDYFFPLTIDSTMKAGLVVVLFLAAFLYLVLRKGRSKDAAAAMAPAMLAALVCELMILSIMGRYPFGGELRHQSIIAPFVVLTGFVVVDVFVAALSHRPARVAAVVLVLTLILVSFGYRWSRFPKVPQELFSEQYRTFHSLFPEGPAVYSDSFSVVIYFTHNHNSPWAFERRYRIGNDWVYVYRTNDELGRSIEIVRDPAVWNFDLSDPGSFKRLAESIRASGLRSAVLFWIKQNGDVLAPKAASAEESRYRAYAGAQGLTWKRSYFDGSQGYIELAID